MALDLRSEFPRSPFAELDGIAWLPRMIDKARAYFAGTNGDYTAYPCPGDQHFLRHFQLDANQVGELIKGGASDEAIVAFVKTQGHCPPEAIAKYNAHQFAAPDSLFLRLALRLMRRKLRPVFQARYPGRDFASIDSFAKMIALEEGHPIPGF